ncbi:MAG TPA: hypothetical protein V6D48_04915 [Oculatellaceae cyanobacterium]
MYTPLESGSALLKSALPAYFVSVFLSLLTSQNTPGHISRLQDILHAK